MSKFLTLGNGQTLAGFDAYGQLRDFYFPRVGLENHIGRGLTHRVGVWVEGEFRWLSEPSWRVSVGCEENSLVGHITAQNEMLGVSLVFSDVVYNEKNILVREVEVTNNKPYDRVIKLFFGQEFQIYESSTAHTAYYDPHHQAIIHYKGQRVFLVSASLGDRPFDDFTTGIRGIWGKEGSFRDAEEGILSKNTIEHGPADSVIAISARYAGGEKKRAYHWLVAGRSLEEAHELHAYTLRHKPEHLLHTTREYWRAWISRRPFIFYGMSEGTVSLFQKSLFILRTHMDNGGGVIASADSDILHQGKDTYAYMWHRDGAYVALALYQSGSYSPAKRFFNFCNQTISKDGYFLHKYETDGSLGSSWHPWVRDGIPSLPIQEDETAIVLHSLWKYYMLSRDIEFIEDIYNSLIRKSARFLVAYRDEHTGLPKPSYDVWEERYGIHTYTASAVYGALEVAGNFAELLGKYDEADGYRSVAKEVQIAILKHLFDAGDSIFYRSAFVDGGRVEVDRTIDASAVYGVFRFGVLPVDDERLVNAMARAKVALAVSGKTGGIKRYLGDNYFRIHPGAEENPWYITTCWFAQYTIARAKSDADLDEVREVLAWCAGGAGESRMMSEQLNPYSGEPVSVMPLTWSHAEYVRTVLEYLERLDQLGICKECNPIEETIQRGLY